MHGLTQKQRTILDFIKQCDAMPSYRTIQRKFSYASVSTVAGHIAALKKKGFLPLPKAEDGACSVPIIGIFQEGRPLEINVHSTSVVWTAKRKETLYALQVQNNQEHILDGDILIIATSTEACDQILCLVEIDGNTHLRRTSLEGPFIRLVSLSGQTQMIAYEDIIVRAHVLEIIRRL